MSRTLANKVDIVNLRRPHSEGAAWNVATARLVDPPREAEAVRDVYSALSYRYSSIACPSIA